MKEEKASIGPLIGSIIVVLLLIMGGYYSLTARPLKTEEPQQTPAVPTAAEVNSPSQANSTEVVDLEKNAGALNTDSLDTNLNDVESAVK